MVKILGICGSPRKAASEYALAQALDAVSRVEGVDTDMITLRGKAINFCVHCDKCIRESADRCTLHSDDMSDLYDRFYAADGYIVASPVYDMAIPGQLVTFFNRFRATYTLLKDNPDYFMRKVGGAIAVGGTRNGGQESAIKVIHDFYNTMGMTVVNGSMAGYAGASVWSRDRKAEGAAEDEFGIKNVRALGLKVAQTALLMAGAGKGGSA
jgi:multimeric flavodoxin WrbA